MSKTIVLVPTYNEAENLEHMVDALLALPINGLEIMVLDDNSPDGTGQIADRLAGEHPGLVHPVHRLKKEGLGRAYRDGYERALAAGADYIVQMDCDFSHPPEKLPEMLAKAQEPGVDLVIGSRYVKGGSLDSEWGWHRKLLSRWANQIYVRLILGTRVEDATAGYRVWTRRVLEGINFEWIRANGYIFQTEMAYVTERLGFNIHEVPIHFSERSRGQSKMDFKIQVEAALRVWQVWHRHRHLRPSDRLHAAPDV
ncbi:MAG: polyprenol monophosphomannose synthase [Anaerolineae bacterium]|nr:polyprenol monophosphomannose synthase [Anaerolineae bacterium]